MRKPLCLGLACAALSLAMVASTAQAEEASPFLPVASWKSTPINLEDLKGQLVVLVFYSDSRA